MRMKKIIHSKSEVLTQKIHAESIKADDRQIKALETFRRPAYSVTNFGCEGKCEMCKRRA